jgi:hypothetical protein
MLNYCRYLSEKKPDAFLKLVFPKLYGVPADEAEEHDIIENNEDLETGKDLIDVINEWARTRGQFKKGSNKNPVTGTGGRPPAKKQDEQENDASADTKQKANPEATDKDEGN